MKAAVLHAFGSAPRYEEVADPVAKDGQIVVRMVAASLKNVDRMMAQGSHYAAEETALPRIAGVDGVCELSDGSLAYAGSPFGMMAEKSVVRKGYVLPLPAGIDPVVAAALPNPGLSAWFALNGKAALQPGETICVLGATGVTGRIAVQLAREAGAKTIIACGRDAAGLDALPSLGATHVVSLREPEAELTATLRALFAEHEPQVVLDYLWGRPAEIVLALLGGSDLEGEARTVRYLQIGEMAGARISLAANTLRSRDIRLFGQGGGSMPNELMAKVPEVLTTLFRRAHDGTLRIDAEPVPLSEVERAWADRVPSGRRLVFTMGHEGSARLR